KAVAIAGRAGVAIRRPAKDGTEAPSAATTDAVRASIRPVYPCSAISRTAAVIAMPVILTPLPHIAVHIVKPKRIWLLLPDRMSLVVGVFRIPSHRIEITRISAGRLRTACILPLGFSRQAILFTSHL